MIKLSIAIPTFNRASSLKNTLERFQYQIKKIPVDIQNNIEILVSNNASTDDTKKTLQEFDDVEFIKYWDQEENIGLDGNIFFL